MRPSTRRFASYRLIAGALVVGAAIVILGVKAARDTTNSLDLPEAQVSAAVGDPGLSEAAVIPGKAGNDPYPTGPGAQVDWVLRNQKAAMILFHSTNCKPCIVMDNLVQKVKGDYEPHLVFIDVITNDRSNMELIQQAQIRAIPTSIFLGESGKAKGFVGAMPEDALRAELDNLISAQ